MDLIQKFYSELSERDKKLMVKSHKEKEEIVLLATDGQNSLVSCGGNNFSPGIMLMTYRTPSINVCLGTIGEKKIVLGEEIGENNFMRVIVDTREPEDIRHHLYYKGENKSHRENSDLTDHIFITYVESSNFSQLCLFDGRNQFKISDVYVISTQIRKQLRIIAFSYIKNLFPEVDTKLPDILKLKVDC